MTTNRLGHYSSPIVNKWGKVHKKAGAFNFYDDVVLSGDYWFNKRDDLMVKVRASISSRAKLILEKHRELFEALGGE